MSRAHSRSPRPVPPPDRQAAPRRWHWLLQGPGPLLSARGSPRGTTSSVCGCSGGGRAIASTRWGTRVGGLEQERECLSSNLQTTVCTDDTVASVMQATWSLRWVPHGTPRLSGGSGQPRSMRTHAVPTGQFLQTVVTALWLLGAGSRPVRWPRVPMAVGLRPPGRTPCRAPGVQPRPRSGKGVTSTGRDAPAEETGWHPGSSPEDQELGASRTIQKAVGPPGPGPTPACSLLGGDSVRQRRSPSLWKAESHRCAPRGGRHPAPPPKARALAPGLDRACPCTGRAARDAALPGARSPAARCSAGQRFSLLDASAPFRPRPHSV